MQIDTISEVQDVGHTTWCQKGIVPKICKNALFDTTSLKNYTLSGARLSPKDPTLSSTNFENPTLFSTETGPNHTLAVLA